MRFTAVAPVFALVTMEAAMAACAARGAGAGSAGQQSSQLVVQNDNWLDVVVYLVHGTARIRMGTVTGLGHATFRIKQGVVATESARLLVDPIGASRGYLTDAITVMPGQRIELRVGSPLNFSTVSTR
jgi:hypothetical protein